MYVTFVVKCCYTAGILEVMFRLLDAYRNKQYITPRVLQLVLTYLAQSYVVFHLLSVFRAPSCPEIPDIPKILKMS